MAEEYEFEPEKVKRLWLDWEDDKGGGWEDDFVFARDYDVLLKLYQAHVVTTDAKIEATVRKVVEPLFKKFIKFVMESADDAEPPTMEMLMEFLAKPEEMPNAL